MANGKIKVAKNAIFCVILKNAIVFGWRNISIQKYPQDFGWCGHLSSVTEYQHLEGGRFI